MVSRVELGGIKALFVGAFGGTDSLEPYADGLMAGSATLAPARGEPPEAAGSHPRPPAAAQLAAAEPAAAEPGAKGQAPAAAAARGFSAACPAA